MLLQNRYEKLEKIGEGAYGVVYKAVDHASKATKVSTPSMSTMLPHVSKHDADGDSAVMAQFAQLLLSSMREGGRSEDWENVDPNKAEQVKMADEETKDGKQELVAIKKLRMMEVDSDILTKIRA